MPGREVGQSGFRVFQDKNGGCFPCKAVPVFARGLCLCATVRPVHPPFVLQSRWVVRAGLIGMQNSSSSRVRVAESGVSTPEKWRSRVMVTRRSKRRVMSTGKSPGEKRWPGMKDTHLWSTTRLA